MNRTSRALLLAVAPLFQLLEEVGDHDELLLVVEAPLGS